jgi:hypothetical protein
MYKSGEIQDCIKVFLAALSGIAGVYGIYNEYTSNQIPVVMWMSGLFAINYWLCFYHLKRKVK